MKRLAIPILVFILLPSVLTGAAHKPVLPTQGFESVKIGMSVEEAEAALKSKLTLNYAAAGPGGDERCGYAERVDGSSLNISYMIENRRITRIDILSPRESADDHRTIVTAAGVGLGSSEADVVRAYGSGLKIEPHPYDPEGHYLEIADPGGKRGIIFETSGGRVTSFRAGVYPAVAYIEGCA